MCCVAVVIPPSLVHNDFSLMILTKSSPFWNETALLFKGDARGIFQDKI
jgi:hypothetical protein